MPRKLVSDGDIVEAYKATGSVWQAAKKLGIAGQTIWERLKSLNYKLSGEVWTNEETSEMLALAGQCTIREIATRLGRPYGSVAVKLSEAGVSGRVRASNRKLKTKQDSFTNDVTDSLINELDGFEGTITQFCRQRSLDIDMVVKAIQNRSPDVWREYSRSRASGPERSCEYCEAMFFPISGKQKTCTRKCQSFLRSDRQYFNGQRRNTIGLEDGVCQLCERECQILSSHHAWGKEHDEESGFLVAMCNGCHKLVGLLSSKKVPESTEFFERLINWVLIRKHGERRPCGFHTAVEIEEIEWEYELSDDPSDSHSVI